MAKRISVHRVQSICNAIRKDATRLTTIVIVLYLLYLYQIKRMSADKEYQFREIIQV